ncbi:MAG TPA: ATP-dependent DNA helicase RecG [Candidatus Paceibacterota bacterium]|nr:ATP-dependent DNA helicase RecG [Candidatus Paceibacterota bacterium]
MNPDDAVEQHFRLTPVQKTALRKLGIATVRDLLYHFPSRYERGGVSGNAGKLVPGTKVSLVGILSKLEAKKLWRSRRPATEGWFEDGSGRVKVLWFNQPYMAKMAPQGVPVKVTGSVGGSPEKPYLTNPEVVPIAAGEVVSEGMFVQPESDGQTAAELFPIYPESRGITSLWFYHALKRVFEKSGHRMPDPLPTDVRERYHLPDLEDALVAIHVPEDERHAEAARKRFSFEEIFSIQVARMKERAENAALPSFEITDARSHARRFLDSLDIKPTGAQTRAINEILSDFEKPQPMARLLEGDVGSGKTLVAAATAYAVVHSRPPGRMSGTLQVAYMAPTEILAQQHFQSFIHFFKDLPINIGLITGSGAKKFPSKIGKDKATDISRTQLLKWVANGEIAMLVGTHALIQKKVQFQHLAYAIVDEQHRFGTRQRRELARKGDATPHFLSMTATPIPRTLALTIYGDLDLSVLDELPPGRATITTKIILPNDRESAYATVRDELRKGRQAYVICPRIEEPDPAKFNALQAKSAKAEAKQLQAEVFPEFRIGLLHGAVKPAEKDEIMRAFAQKEIDILVATSVVEVGINVPNATVILIEGAERFGLAQLHQLRGRVQRSSHPPYCFLLPETKGDMAMKRLRALEKSADGFALAEADLATRGAGDLSGARQWGMSDLGMEALKNARLIQAAREEAQALVEKDPTLSNHAALAARIALAGTPHVE